MNITRHTKINTPPPLIETPLFFSFYNLSLILPLFFPFMFKKTKRKQSQNREKSHLFMDPIQNQAKTQETHPLLPPFEQKKHGIEAQNREESKNEEKFEKQSISLSAHKWKNVDQNEKLEITHLKTQDKKSMAMNNRIEERDNGVGFGPRERLKRHRTEVAGQVWIPDLWGQEELLKDWIDCSAFESCLMPHAIMSARASLIEEGRRANTTSLRVENGC